MNELLMVDAANLYWLFFPERIADFVDEVNDEFRLFWNGTGNLIELEPQ